MSHDKRSMRTRLGDFFDFSSIDCLNFSTQAEKSVPVEQERILAKEEPSDLIQTTHGEGKGADAPGNGSTMKICYDTEALKEFFNRKKEKTPTLVTLQKIKGRLSWAIPEIHLELELSHQLFIPDYSDDASSFPKGSWAGASLIPPTQCECRVGGDLSIPEYYLDYAISLCEADFLSVKLSAYQICDERLRLNLSKLPIRFLIPKPDT